MDFKYLTDSSYSQELTLRKKAKNLIKEMYEAVLKNSSIVNDVEYDFDNHVFIVSFFRSDFDNFALMIPMDGFEVNQPTVSEYWNDGMQQDIIDDWVHIDRSNYMDMDIDHDEIIAFGIDQDDFRIFILEE